MATIQQLQAIENQRKSGFNWLLPSGEVIKSGINPSQAATVSVESILSGGTAANVPPEILETARTQMAGRTPRFQRTMGRGGTPDLTPSPTAFAPLAPGQPSFLAGAPFAGTPATPIVGTLPGQKPSFEQFIIDFGYNPAEIDELERQSLLSEYHRQYGTTAPITPTPPTAPATPAPPQPFTPTEGDILQKYLGEGVVTSALTDIQKLFEKREEALEKREEAGKARIESIFAGEEEEEMEERRRRIEEALARKRGIGPVATQALVSALEKDSDKRISTLERRKEEALLNLDFQSADRYDKIIGDEISFIQTTRQQAISNALSLARFELDVQQEERLETTAKANFMTEFPEAGINVEDTFMEATEKAQSWLIQHPEVGGELRTVEGVGLVRIGRDGIPRVIMPEQPSGGIPFGFGLTQTEILGEITSAINNLNKTNLTESQREVLFQSIPSDIMSFIRRDELGIGFTLNEPTKDQYEEIIYNRNLKRQAGITPNIENKIIGDTGLNSEQLKEAVKEALLTGMSDAEILKDFQTETNLPENFIRNIILMAHLDLVGISGMAIGGFGSQELLGGISGGLQTTTAKF